MYMVIPPKGSNGWYTPDDSEYVHAFIITSNRLSMEYWTGDDMILDIHLNTDDIHKLITNDHLPIKEEQNCPACGRGAKYGVKLDEGQIQPIHERCYVSFLKAMNELLEDYPEAVTVELL